MILGQTLLVDVRERVLMVVDFVEKVQTTVGKRSVSARRTRSLELRESRDATLTYLDSLSVLPLQPVPRPYLLDCWREVTTSQLRIEAVRRRR